jgi:hypothetical protein
MGNSITYTTNYNHKTVATLHALQTWFVSGTVKLQLSVRGPHRGDDGYENTRIMK